MKLRLSIFISLCAGLLTIVGSVCGQDLRRASFMGVQAAPVTDEVRSRLHIGEPEGILVLGLVAGGSGKEAGLEPNDVITQIGDHHILDVRDFVATVGKLHAGDSATIRFFRSGATQTKRTLLKPRPFETSADGDTLYKSVSIDDSLRRVIITKPKGEGRHPAILYVNGIGCFSQESLDLSSMDTKLLYGLTRAGFVTMRVEKSSMGDSQGPPCMSPTVDLQAEMRGYVAGLKALKEYPFVDPNQVFVVGLSIGGVEAPLVAEQVQVKGIIVINTVAKPFLEYLMDTRRRQHLLRHTPYDEMERRLRLNEQCNHRLVIERETPDQLLKEIPDCGDYITYPAPYTYMQQWAALNPAQEWKKVDAPVLVVYGTSDFISTIVDDPYLVDIINSFHPGRATIKTIPNMDHYLTRAASMEESITRAAGSRVEFEPAVLEAIKDWLQQQMSPAAPANR
jgi:pimeloyl-ACP methyl ester carboxylesterase